MQWVPGPHQTIERLKLAIKCKQKSFVAHHKVLQLLAIIFWLCFMSPFYLLREEWHAYDPYLISEGLFGAGMISSYLKIVQILSVNPRLGPLQISLGRMIMDILIC